MTQIKQRTNALVIIDPFVETPESATYNFFVHAAMSHAKKPASFIDTVQFFMPCKDTQNLSDFLKDVDPIGVISLGSLANVTDHAPWVTKLAEDLKNLIFARNIPFLGICFAHQLLAHIYGGEVNFLKERHNIPSGKHHKYRRVRLTHPKLRLLFASMETTDYFSENEIDLGFRSSFQLTKNWNAQRWQSFLEEPETHSAQEKRLAQFLEQQTPTAFIAHARHEQEVHTFQFPLINAATSEDCQIEALVHESSPIFSVQTHPETPHEMGLGERLLKNFIYFCSLGPGERT